MCREGEGRGSGESNAQATDVHNTPRADLGSSGVAVVSGYHHVGAKLDCAGRGGAGSYEPRERRSEPRTNGYQ